MKKARRFMCPTASRSSPSNTTIRSQRKSRMSSGGGDSLPQSKTVGRSFATRPTRARSAKCSLRTLPGNLKNSKKAAKALRGPRPNLGNLQNAVVLAPFHTLKKCFQTKLVDLYSYEKQKKIQQKTKLAKRKNMSFEYDIIEMQPAGSTVKKETKATKKSKRKSRSASYCQCKKAVGKPAHNNPKLTRTASGGEALPPGAPGSSGHLRAKRRRLNPVTPAPTTLNSAIATGLDLCGPGDPFSLSEANPTLSVVSFRSKSDSWESCGDSPPCREDRMQGSLAISTTSFDSYLESFDKGTLDRSESKRKCSRRTPIRRDLEGVDAGLIRKPSARHLIEQVERKNTDEEISDFLDREPQTQEIPSLESDRHWQPLRRQSKTKAKKPENEEATAAYYLRSLSSGKKDSEGTSTPNPASRQECRSSCPDASDRTKISQIEVGTQVEGNGPAMPGPSFPSSKSAQQESTLDAHRADAPLEEDSGEPPCDSRLGASRQRAPSPPLGPLLQPSPPADPAADQAALGEHSDLASTEAGGLREAFEGVADPYEPREKESAYIFGARSGENSLGESCEFSFGLKWVFSDDED